MIKGHTFFVEYGHSKNRKILTNINTNKIIVVNIEINLSNKMIAFI